MISIGGALQHFFLKLVHWHWFKGLALDVAIVDDLAGHHQGHAEENLLCTAQGVVPVDRCHMGRDAGAAHTPGTESKNQIEHRVRNLAIELAKERGEVLLEHVTRRASQYLKTFRV